MAVVSETSISNMALSHIGILKGIENITTDNSAEARACKLWYEQVRDRILSQFWWGFAKTRVNLQLSTVDVPEGWTYAYDYPSDCLFARRIIDPYVRTPGARQKIPFTQYQDEANASKLILCDQATAVLEYTKLITDPTIFSPLFVDCLAWGLAERISTPLRVSAELKKEARQNAMYWLNEAASRHLAEEQEDPEPESEFVTYRI